MLLRVFKIHLIAALECVHADTSADGHDLLLFLFNCLCAELSPLEKMTRGWSLKILLPLVIYFLGFCDFFLIFRIFCLLRGGIFWDFSFLKSRHPQITLKFKLFNLFQVHRVNMNDSCPRCWGESNHSLQNTSIWESRSLPMSYST